MKKLNNNSGASMVEVMIYMVIALIVIGYALNSMGTISKGYVRSRTVNKMQKDGRDAVQVMAREIGNTGFKFYIDIFTADVNTESATSPGTFFVVPTTHYFTRPTRSPQIYTRDFDPSNTTTNTAFLPVNTTFPVASDDANWLYATYFGLFNDDDATTHAINDSSASFSFVSGANYDQLTILSATLAGTNNLENIKQITYFVGTDTLYRVERIALASDLNTATGLPAVRRELVWRYDVASKPDTMAILDNVAAMQFLFSPDGTASSWINDPEDVRHLQKVIKIQLLVKSDRTVDQNVGVDHRLGVDGNGNGGVVINDPTTIFRLYEKVVEIPNNGIIAL